MIKRFILNWFRLQSFSAWHCSLRPGGQTGHAKDRRAAYPGYAAYACSAGRRIV
jgi:hypothetical protein